MKGCTFAISQWERGGWDCSVEERSETTRSFKPDEERKAANHDQRWLACVLAVFCPAGGAVILLSAWRRVSLRWAIHTEGSVVTAFRQHWGGLALFRWLAPPTWPAVLWLVPTTTTHRSSQQGHERSAGSQFLPVLCLRWRGLMKINKKCDRHNGRRSGRRGNWGIWSCDSSLTDVQGAGVLVCVAMWVRTVVTEGTCCRGWRCGKGREGGRGLAVERRLFPF